MKRTFFYIALNEQTARPTSQRKEVLFFTLSFFAPSHLLLSANAQADSKAKAKEPNFPTHLYR